MIWITEKTKPKQHKETENKKESWVNHRQKNTEEIRLQGSSSRPHLWTDHELPAESFPSQKINQTEETAP